MLTEELIIKSIKENPALVVLDFLIATVLILFAVQTFASNSDVAGIQGNINQRITGVEIRLTGLERTVMIQAKEQTLRDLETQIYNLQNLVSDGEANERDLNRLSEKRIERDKTLRELDVIQQSIRK